MDSDIIEIKLYDETHTILFKGKYKINNHLEFKRLNHDLKHKTNLQMSKTQISGWFD